MKKFTALAIVVAVIAAGIFIINPYISATSYPFENLFEEGFAGYTSDEGEILTTDYVSSEQVSVSSGETIYFGPCDPTQYFQLVGFSSDGAAVTDKVRGKDLDITDTFENDMVIYSYTVPSGVSYIIFSAPADVSNVYTVSKTEITNIIWRAYWSLNDVDTSAYVGTSSYYSVSAGDKLYFGAISKSDALSSTMYDSSGSKMGIISSDDLTLVESFGGSYGIYCYTVPRINTPEYVYVNYDIDYADYYTCVTISSGDSTDEEIIVDDMIASYGIPTVAGATIDTLSGKSALFVGDSITYGAYDTSCIYGVRSWAGRIGYFCNMDVTNNGVSGACISTARVGSSGSDHYIYNNLVAANGNEYDFVIMHGLFNDASDGVSLGTPQGKKSFRESKADTSTFAGGLEMLFYTAAKQHPEAILGYIVNFDTERAVDLSEYVEMAIQICEDWGVEYLDLYNNSSFAVDLSDGLHPSSAGYDSMYLNVANWMAALANGTAGISYDSGSSAKVLSYNIYYSAVDAVSSDYTINNRVSKIKSLIGEEDADILLLQEVGSGWAGTITKFANENGYSYYGYSHYSSHSLENSASNDQYTPVLWKNDKYDLKASGHFWLSSTPDVAASASWDNGTTSNYPRCVNWVIITDRNTGEDLFVSSVHMDPNVEEVRVLSSELIIDKFAEIRAQYGNPAAVIGGDWNVSDLTSTMYKNITGNGFLDVRLCADLIDGSGTYNAWSRTGNFTLGDYVFIADGMTASSYTVVDDYDTESGLHLSDHSPIRAVINY